MSTLALNIIGGALILLGTAIVMYASYKSDKENSQLVFQLHTLEASVTPQGIDELARQREFDRFMGALQSRSSLEEFFPRAFSFQITEVQYDTIAEYVHMALGENQPFAESQEILRMLRNKYPEKVQSDPRLNWLVGRYFPEIAGELDHHKIYSFISEAFEIFKIKNDISSALVLRNMLWISRDYYSLEPLKYLATRFPDPDSRALLRKALAMQIPDKDTPFWGTHFAFHVSVDSRFIEALDDLEEMENSEL